MSWQIMTEALVCVSRSAISYTEQAVLILQHILFSFAWPCDAGRADLYHLYKSPQSATNSPGAAPNIVSCERSFLKSCSFCILKCKHMLCHARNLFHWSESALGEESHATLVSWQALRSQCKGWADALMSSEVSDSRAFSGVAWSLL